MILLCECNFKSLSSREGCPTKVRWMVGPYWNMLIVTYSILLLISVLIYGVLVPRSISFIYLSVGLNLTSTTFVLLTLTACRDPGIFPRHTRPLVCMRLLTSKHNSRDLIKVLPNTISQGSDWTYSGQAGSFRPPKTIYCKETELLIEGYDHFCPWYAHYSNPHRLNLPTQFYGQLISYQVGHCYRRKESMVFQVLRCVPFHYDAV